MGVLIEPLDPSAVRALLKSIVEQGNVRFSRHALEEMKKDGVDEADVLRALTAGAVSQGEWENGSWRYRVRTAEIVVVVTFRDDTLVIVVTAWTTRKR